MIRLLLPLSIFLSIFTFSLSYRTIEASSTSFAREEVSSIVSLMNSTRLRISSLNSTEMNQHYTAILSQIARLGSNDRTKIRLTAIDPINRTNLPNDLELWVIAYMRASNEKKFLGTTTFKEREYMVGAEAVVPDTSCLRCHSGSLWKPGSIQGVLAVYTEISGLKRKALLSSAVTGVGTGLLFFISGLLLRKKIRRA